MTGQVTRAPLPPTPPSSSSVRATDKTLDVPSNISGNESLKHDQATPTSPPALGQKRLTNLADTVHLTDDGGKSELKEREEDAREVTQGEGDKEEKQKKVYINLHSELFTVQNKKQKGFW